MPIQIRPSPAAATPSSEGQCPRHAALKSFACGVAALAVTALFSWSFVHTTAIERVGSGLATLSAATDVGRQGR